MTPAVESAEEAVPDDGRLVGRNIVTGYGNHTVIHDVTVSSRDSVTCIFGPNGSGKSTLIKALNGAVPIWEGEITFDGTDLTGTPAYEMVEHGIVTLSQDGGLFPSLSVEENLKLGAYTVDDKSIVRDRLSGVYDDIPLLKEKQSTHAGSLSGGQQMILSFGRAMMFDANIYLLDEPSAGLAPSLIDDLLNMIRRLTERDAQVILVEQNVQAALRVADYAYILAQGALKFRGTAEELAEEDRLLDLYLGIE